MGLSSKLDSSHSLTEDVQLPPDFAIALMSGRSELLRLIKRPLSLEETTQVAHAMSVLLDTQRELQIHSEYLAQQVEQLRGHAKGLINKIDQIWDQACFREPLSEAGDGNRN